MREDIKHLIKNRPLWQEHNTIEEKPVLPVEQIVKKMKQEHPYLTELFTAYIIAKREHDELTATEVKRLIQEHKSK